MADPVERLSRHSRVQRSRRRSRDVVARSRAAAPWHEIIVVDDGSTDDDRRAAAAAGATVVRHPYNKGNGAAVKSGIRRATGEFVLIIDGDGQHPAGGCAAASSRGSASTDLVDRRAHRRRRRRRRRGAPATRALNWLASYLTGREIPDLTSGFRGARRECLREFLHLLPERLLDADDDDAGVHQGGLQRRVRADRGAAAGGHLEDPARARRREVPDHHLQDRHAVQPAAGLPADQPRVVRVGRGLRDLDDRDTARTSPTRRSC